MNDKLHLLPIKAQEIVKKLGLEHTYEGIYLKRIYQKGNLLRPDATSIYALSAWHAPSLLHRLDCDELWHFYTGCPLDIYIIENDVLRKETLGNDIYSGQNPFVAVPKGAVFGALVAGEDDWCLYGCTCIPGFDTEKCEFIKRFDPVLQKVEIAPSILHMLTEYYD